MGIRYFFYNRSANSARQIADFWKRTNYAPALPSQKLWEHISWKYSPFFTHIRLAKTKRGIIGSCGRLDLTAQTSSGTLRVNWGIDSLVDHNHPDFHRFVFLKVYRKTFDPLRLFDIALAFPSRQSKDFHLKTGWKRIVSAQLFMSIFNPKALQCLDKQERADIASGLHKNRGCCRSEISLPCGIRARKIKRFPAKAIKSFFEKICPGFAFVFDRNAYYLDWRYGRCPTRTYDIYTVWRGGELLGYFVLNFKVMKKLKIGYLIDILADPASPENFAYLISLAKERFKEQKIDIAYTMATHKTLKQALGNAGFFPYRPVSLLSFMHDRTRFGHLMTQLDQWFITMGDGDFEME